MERERHLPGPDLREGVNVPKARVKLLTLWAGDLPSWLPQFENRVRASRVVDWELIRAEGLSKIAQPPNLVARVIVNVLAATVAGVPCRKATPYSLGDLRPLLGEMFAGRVEGYEWWGWCDLDIVTGDLDRLLPPLLDAYDVISTDGRVIHGPLTLLRNKSEVNNLYRQADFASVLASPDYMNFDETGFNPPDAAGSNGNPSFTEAVNGSGLRVHYDDRSWTESYDTLWGGFPSRCCELDGDRLIEVPTGRELLMYHFTSKAWPLPNRYAEYRQLQLDHLEGRAYPRPVSVTDEPPAESPEYWARRLKKVIESGEPVHKSVFDCPVGDWEAIQAHTAKLLRSLLGPGDKVLDAGCGYGVLAECLPKMPAYLVGSYTGVDYCPEMVDYAKVREGDASHTFLDGDIRSLPFSDKQFDWCVCRGLEGTFKTLLGNREWDRAQAEMLRVAKRLLLIDYSFNHRVVEG